jgi:hypothetical protein
MQPARSYEETVLHIVDMIPMRNEELNQMDDGDMVSGLGVLSNGRYKFDLCLSSQYSTCCSHIATLLPFAVCDFTEIMSVKILKQPWNHSRTQPGTC